MQRRMPGRWARLVAVLLAAMPCIASAHGLLLDAESDGEVITGQVFYTNGELAVRESVELLDLSSTTGAQPVPAKTDDDGRFQFPVVADHLYRVSAYGEEGHSVDVEIHAKQAARPKLVETESSVKEEATLPPAWAVIGALLLLSMVPVAYRRLRRA